MKNFGVDVTIVEFLDRMVPTEDADVSKELLKHVQEARREGAALHQGRDVEDTGSGVKVTVSPADGGDSQVLEADKVLAAFGFAPAGRGLRPRGGRRGAHRPWRDRDRRARPHQRRGRLRDRRRAPAS